MDLHILPRRRTILLFTWAAGGVDAIVYMMAHVFTANMTGNAVLLGISLAKQLSMATVHSLIALITFAIGVMLSSFLVGEKSHGIPWKGVRIAVVTESLVLALFAVVFFLPLSHTSEISLAAMIVLSGLAMGMQSATVARLKMPGIATTYITGTLTSLLSGLVHHWDAEEQESEQEELKEERSIALQAWVFMLYAASAFTSALVYKHWPSGVALMPLIAIIAVALTLHKPRRPRRLPESTASRDRLPKSP